MMNKKLSVMSEVSLKTDDLSVNTSVYKFSPRRRKELVLDAIYSWNEEEQKKA